MIGHSGHGGQFDETVSIVIGALGLAVSLAIIPARAQNSDRDRPRLVESSFDLQPGLTKDTFDELAAEIGSVLRFRQLGDTATIGRGHVAGVRLDQAEHHVIDRAV